MTDYEQALPSSSSGRRHPFLVWLACIALADRIVPVVWHDGFPHRPPCDFAGCRYPMYQQFSFRKTGTWVLGVLAWRRQAVFDNGGERGQDSPHLSQRIAWELGSGALPWEIGIRARTRMDLEKVLADLRSLARDLGIPQDPPMLDHVRAYMAGVLKVLAEDTQAQP